jgi:hypothetical protein
MATAYIIGLGNRGVSERGAVYMKIVPCEKCDKNTPEGFSLCTACMREAGAGEQEVFVASDMLDIVNILNIGDTYASRMAAIDSILNISKKLEGKTDEEKEKK